MKCIMYHYIRDYDNQFPHFRYLSKSKFLKQLDFFERNGGLISSIEKFKGENFLLTFDDGFKDHLFAAECLKKRNKIGIFFIPTFPYKEKKILNVHRIHILLGKLGGLECMNNLKNFLNKNNILMSKKKLLFKNAYRDQINDKDTLEFKKILNYNLGFEQKNIFLNEMFVDYNIKLKYSDIYLSIKELKYLVDLGMIIGSHSHSHEVLSRYNDNQQNFEISFSKEFLQKKIGININLFCYPYGSKNTFNQSSRNFLKRNNYKYAFMVNPKDFNEIQIKKRPYDFPRYDCSLF